MKAEDFLLLVMSQKQSPELSCCYKQVENETKYQTIVFTQDKKKYENMIP